MAKKKQRRHLHKSSPYGTFFIDRFIGNNRQQDGFYLVKTKDDEDGKVLKFKRLDAARNYISKDEKRFVEISNFKPGVDSQGKTRIPRAYLRASQMTTRGATPTRVGVADVGHALNQAIKGAQRYVMQMFKGEEVVVDLRTGKLYSEAK